MKYIPLNLNSKKLQFFFICFILSIIGHSFFIYKYITQGITMVCPYDQLDQILAFKSYLYNQFKTGTFFFDFQANVGGNFFNRLSYYYSTSIFFYATCIVTYFLESFELIKNPSYVYWGESILYISIIRTSLIIYVTSKYLEYLDARKKVALLSASIYAICIINFVHTSCWEFFSDAILWLPIIFYGIEKIIRKESGKIFVLGITLSLFNNAYFAYINIWLAIFYVLIRWTIRFDPQELERHKQFVKYLFYGIISVLISLPGFSAFFLGFSNTSRPEPLEINAPLLFLDTKKLASMFFDSKVCIVPILLIFLLFTIRIYKTRKSIFALITSILFIILNSNYFLGSLFNGFSAVQFRWNYGVSLFLAIAISILLEEFLKQIEENKLCIWDVIFSILAGIIMYILLIYIFKFNIRLNKIMLLALLLSSVLFALIAKFHNNRFILSTIIFLLFSCHCLAILSVEKNTFEHKIPLVNIAYLRMLENKDSDINKALEYIDKNKISQINRVYVCAYDIHDNKYPLNYMHTRKINNLYIYTSFQNKNQQNFEEKFEISPFYKNSGEVSGPSDRKNLYSLLNIDYIICKKNTNKVIIPSSFSRAKDFNSIEIYKNNYPHNFVHTVDNLYSEDDLSSNDYKDDLIIDGAIVENNKIKKGRKTPKRPLSVKNDIELENLKQNKNIYQTIDKNKRSKIIVKLNNDIVNPNKELNISYFIKPINSSDSRYKINGIEKRIVSEDILYGRRFYRNQVEIKPNANNEIIFDLDPNIKYEFKIFDIRLTSEKSLKYSSLYSSKQNVNINLQKNSINIDYFNKENKKFMVLPIFVANGLELKVNNIDREIIKTNYGMVGFYLDNGKNNIEIIYKQPYFKTFCLISILSLIILLYIDKKVYK